MPSATCVFLQDDGGIIYKFNPTGSPAPSVALQWYRSEEVFGRRLSKTEYNMLKGLKTHPVKQRIHSLVSILFGKLDLQQTEQVEEAAWILYRKGEKKGLRLPASDYVVALFYYAALSRGLSSQHVLSALALSQCLDRGLKLGLSRLRFNAKEFIAEIPCSFREFRFDFWVDGHTRKIGVRIEEQRSNSHSRVYSIKWNPLLSDCLDGDGVRQVFRTVSLHLVESNGERWQANLVYKNKSEEWANSITVNLDPKHFFYLIRLLKKIELEIGIPISSNSSSAQVAFKRLSPSTMAISNILLRKVGLLNQVELDAQKYLKGNDGMSPVKRAAAALVAADMQRFKRIPGRQKHGLFYELVGLPLTREDRRYVGVEGLIVPGEMERKAGIDWGEILRLALLLQEQVKS